MRKVPEILTPSKLKNLMLAAVVAFTMSGCRDTLRGIAIEKGIPDDKHCSIGNMSIRTTNDYTVATDGAVSILDVNNDGLNKGDMASGMTLDGISHTPISNSRDIQIYSGYYDAILNQLKNTTTAPDC